MEIRDLTKEYQSTFLHCLEDWSDPMKESGNHKAIWYQKMKDKGHRVKIAIEDNQACGMIQYIPSELAFIEGHDLYFIQCIWVHGYKQGVGNRQKKGIGKALQATARATRKSARILGLKTQIAAATRKRQKLFGEIGERYFALQKRKGPTPAGEKALADLVKAAEAANREIRDLEAKEKLERQTP